MFKWFRSNFRFGIERKHKRHMKEKGTCVDLSEHEWIWKRSIRKVTKEIKKKERRSFGEDAKHDDFKIKFLYILNSQKFMYFLIWRWRARQGVGGVAGLQREREKGSTWKAARSRWWDGDQTSVWDAPSSLDAAKRCLTEMPICPGWRLLIKRWRAGKLFQEKRCPHRRWFQTVGVYKS